MIPKQRPQPRNEIPDLHKIASANECTGVLPAQLPGCMPEDDSEDDA